MNYITISYAYNLLNDLDELKKKSMLEREELEYLLSSKLSHKYSESLLGRLYLRHYYAPMVASALNRFEKGHFLELGCGTGTQVILAMKSGFKSATGVDMMPDRIKIAKKRASFYHVQDNICFEVKDFWEMNLNLSFDAIYSMFAFELFGSPPIEACQHLLSLSSKQSTIILDMGRVQQLNKKNYFFELAYNLEKEGFNVEIEPLFPFMINNKMSGIIGKYNLYPFFRAIRLVAYRN